MSDNEQYEVKEVEHGSTYTASEAKLLLQSYSPTNGTRTLMLVGAVLAVIGLLGAASSTSPYLFIGVGGLGVSMLVMTTVTRPLDRILAQLVEINDKLSDEFSDRE